MRRRGEDQLPNRIAEKIISRIFGGEYAPGTALPSEPALEAEFEVSRVVIREGIRALRARNILRINSGVGTFVNPPREWTSLDLLFRYAAENASEGETVRQLIEVRRAVENAAARLAATYRDDVELASIARHLGEMAAAAEASEVGAFVEADLGFHDAIFDASHNIFLPTLMLPVRKLLRADRYLTGSVPAIQAHAIARHRAVFNAIERQDADAAYRAMDDHMSQTMHDYETYLVASELEEASE